MFSNLSSKKTINSVKEIAGGKHGNHWEAYLGFEVGAHEPNFSNQLIELIQETTKLPSSFVNKTVEIKGNDAVKVIVNQKLISSAFPNFQPSNTFDYKIKSISKWKSGEGLEASVEGGLTGDLPCSISFFALDYLEKKKIYENENPVKVGLTGLIMQVEDRKEFLKNMTFSISENFTGFFPLTDILDTVEIIGQIKEITEYKNAYFEGYKLKLKIADTGDDQLILDFLLHKNLNTYPDELKQDNFIIAYSWIAGQILE
jgi:hypothetical protein